MGKDLTLTKRQREQFGNISGGVISTLLNRDYDDAYSTEVRESSFFDAEIERHAEITKGEMRVRVSVFAERAATDEPVRKAQ